MDRTTSFRDSGIQLIQNLLAGTEEGRADAEEVLFDSVTHLPRLHVLLKDLRSRIVKSNEVGILTLNVSPFVPLEDMFGWDAFDRVIVTIAESLQEIKEECLRDSDSVAELSMNGNSFVFLLSAPRYNQFIAYKDLAALRGRIYTTLQEKLAKGFPPELVSQFGCFIGCTVIPRHPGARMDRVILRALDRAYSDAFQERERGLNERVTRLNEIIDRGQMTVVYQAIVDLKEEKIFGYEALSRGPEGEFANPEYMFEIAHEANILWKLERACRQLALDTASELPEGCTLFLNIEPGSVFDPELGELSTAGLSPRRVVLEITERAAVKDYGLFRQALDLARGIGLRLAVDDVGAGYSGLRLLSETQPDFIKLDMNFIRNIQDKAVNRALVGVIAQLAETLDVVLIVEGVETREELEIIRAVGIRYAQGYLFSRPQPGFAEVKFEQLGALSRPRGRKRANKQKRLQT